MTSISPTINMPSSRRAILPVIVFSQFAGTSLWFAVNAVIGDIAPQNGGASGMALLTTIVQLGFIAGTFVFALFGVADRFRASTVFLLSSLIAAAANALLLCLPHDPGTLSLLRFLTGFFLAGIYPVGMKIAAAEFPGRLGNALGFLVGALVLGTAFPHLVRASLGTVSWKWVLGLTSALAVTGGVAIRCFVPGIKPVRSGARFQPRALATIFRSPRFRAAADGYFGHMWELYAFWAFLPFFIGLYNSRTGSALPVSSIAFFAIGAGFVSCVAGGYLSKSIGSFRVAAGALALSGVLCAVSPFLFSASPPIFVAALCLWGAAVVADSPQFSALVAETAPAGQTGSALTFVTSIGFAITIASIQLLRFVQHDAGIYTFLFLLPGPLAGLLALRRMRL
jgi:MFS family permease